MRVIIPGFVIFFVSGLFLLPEFIGESKLPGAFYIYAPLSLMLMGIMIQAEGILSIRRQAGSRKLSAAADTLETELRDTIEKLHEEKKRSTDYRTQLAHAERQLRSAEKKSKDLEQHRDDSLLQLREALSAEKHRNNSLTEELAEVKKQKGDGDLRVIQLLNLLQEKGRFLDFVMDDVTSFQDQQVGAAARVVHSGCSQVMKDYFDIMPVREESEGSLISLHEQENGAEHRLVGKVGTPPWNGRLLHRGWKTKKVGLPERTTEYDGHEEGCNSGKIRPHVIAPAQIELS